MKFLASLLFILFISLSCWKDDDKEDPVIMLNTPAFGQIFNNGDNVSITGTVTDNKGISELHIRITNSETGAEILFIDPPVTGTSASFNQVFHASSGIHYRLQVIAKDLVKNDGRVVMEFRCN